MADDQIEVQITADIAQLEAAIQKIAAACEKLEATATKAADKGKQKTEDWTKAFEPLQHAFDQSISGMILGTTTWQKAVQRLGQMAVSEMVGVADKQLATWLGSELGMTAATKSATQTRQGVEQQSQSGMLGLMGNMLLKWLGLETAKTAATTEGVGERTAVEASGQSAGLAQMAINALKTIGASAAEAAASVYATVSAIPYVGWILAPPAAAGAFAAVMAYRALVPSAAGG